MRKSVAVSTFTFLTKVPRLRRDYLAVLLELRARYGDAFSVEFPKRAHYLFHPEDVSQVLRDRAHRYRKSDNYREMDILLGRGVLTTDGEEWKEKRRVVAPEFHASQLARFEPLIRRRVERMLETWRGREVVDIGEELNRLAFGIAGEAFFGAELAERSREMAGALETATEGALKRILSPLKLPLSFPAPVNLRIRRSVAKIDTIVASLIETRKRGAGGETLDVLGRLLARATPGPAGERDVRDQSVTLLLAGHETTSLATTWLFHLLAWNPRCRAEVTEEARASRPTDEVLAPAIDESLRLYPSVPVISRNALEDDEFSTELRIGAGEMVQLSPWVTHRHPEFWSDASVFRPDRFAPARKAALASGAYFPFGMGPRVCIGATLALSQMKMIVQEVTRRFEFEPADTRPVEIRPSITLRPSRPVRLRIRARA